MQKPIRMKPSNENKKKDPDKYKRLSYQERRLYRMFKRGGCYTVADMVRELGQCDPRGHIAHMRFKGIGIADKRISRPNGSWCKLYWLAE